MYRDLLYRDETVDAFFETSELLVGDDYKLWKNVVVFYGNTGNIQQSLIITPDNNSNLSKNVTFTFVADGFDPNYFSPTFYVTATNTDDYKLVHINMYARWMRFRVQCVTKFNFRGFKINVQGVSNQE